MHSVLDDDDIYVTTPQRMTELMIAWREIGVTSFIIEVAAPIRRREGHLPLTG